MMDASKRNVRDLRTVFYCYVVDRVRQLLRRRGSVVPGNLDVILRQAEVFDDLGAATVARNEFEDILAGSCSNGGSAAAAIDRSRAAAERNMGFASARLEKIMPFAGFVVEGERAAAAIDTDPP